MFSKAKLGGLLAALTLVLVQATATAASAGLTGGRQLDKLVLRASQLGRVTSFSTAPTVAVRRALSPSTCATTDSGAKRLGPPTAGELRPGRRSDQVFERGRHICAWRNTARAQRVEPGGEPLPQRADPEHGAWCSSTHLSDHPALHRRTTSRSCRAPGERLGRPKGQATFRDRYCDLPGTRHRPLRPLRLRRIGQGTRTRRAARSEAVPREPHRVALTGAIGWASVRE